MGLEPTNGGITIHCLNHLATPAIIAINTITFRTVESPSVTQIFQQFSLWVSCLGETLGCRHHEPLSLGLEVLGSKQKPSREGYPGRPVCFSRLLL
jgi:hypothetical protein